MLSFFSIIIFMLSFFVIISYSRKRDTLLLNLQKNILLTTVNVMSFVKVAFLFKHQIKIKRNYCSGTEVSLAAPAIQPPGNGPADLPREEGGRATCQM